MLFPSPGSVLSTLHGQGQVMVSGVLFLMGPFQRESHRLWSSPSLQRDRGQYSGAEKLRLWSLREYEGCFGAGERTIPDQTRQYYQTLNGLGNYERETEGRRWSPLSMTSLRWKVSISCSTSLRPVMFYSWLMWADLDWAMICTDWHGSTHFSKANSCEDSRSSLAHHSPVSLTRVSDFSWDVFGVAHKVWLFWMDMCVCYRKKIENFLSLFLADISNCSINNSCVEYIVTFLFIADNFVIEIVCCYTSMMQKWVMLRVQIMDDEMNNSSIRSNPVAYYSTSHDRKSKQAMTSTLPCPLFLLSW